LLTNHHDEDTHVLSSLSFSSPTSKRVVAIGGMWAMAPCNRVTVRQLHPIRRHATAFFHRSEASIVSSRDTFHRSSRLSRKGTVSVLSRSWAQIIFEFFWLPTMFTTRLIASSYS
jgi:hypothetical protein